MESFMKVNYNNEDYMSSLFSIIIFVLIFIVILVWGITTKVLYKFSGLAFTGIFIIIMGVFFIVEMKDYKKRRQQRNLNLYIMKNGECIKGKIVSIYDHFISGVDLQHGAHNIIAEVRYHMNDKEEIIVVDNIQLKFNELEKYQNKMVNIYIYNNMNYIDIINS